MAMRRIAHQEDPSLPELLRQHPLHRPARDLVDLHRQIADAELSAHVLFDLLVRQSLRAFALIGDVEDPLLAVWTPMVGSHRHEHSHLADGGTPDPANQHVRVRRKLRQAGREIDMRGSRLEEDAKALNVDADDLGDGATAVTTEDVPAPHRVLFAGVMVLDLRRYAIAVLLQPDELMMKPDLARIELLGARLHKRFETNLREIGAAAGTGLQPVEIFISAAPGLHLGDQLAEIRVLAGEARIPAHVAHILGGGALGKDWFGDADVAEDLHGALIEHVRLGQDRGAGQRGYEKVLDAKRRQQHRTGQTGTAAAHDQNWRFICHGLSLSLSKNLARQRVETLQPVARLNPYSAPQAFSSVNPQLLGFIGTYSCQGRGSHIPSSGMNWSISV